MLPYARATGIPRALWWFLLLSALATAQAASGATAQVESLRQQTATLFAAGNFRESLDVNARWIKAAGNDWRAYQAQGLTLAQLGQKKAALQSLSQAQRLAPTEVEPMLSLALIYAMIHDADQANQWLENAKANGAMTASPKYYLTRGQMHWLLLQDRQAVDDAQQALAVDAASAAAHDFLCTLYGKSANAEVRNGHLAVRHGEKAVALEPDNPFYRVHYSYGLYDAGQTAAALAQLTELKKRVSGKGPAIVQAVDTAWTAIKQNACVRDTSLDAFEKYTQPDRQTYLRYQNGKLRFWLKIDNTQRELTYFQEKRLWDNEREALLMGKALTCSASDVLVRSGIHDRAGKLQSQPVVIAEILESALPACAVRAGTTVTINNRLVAADASLVGKKDTLQGTFFFAILQEGVELYAAKPQPVTVYNAKMTEFSTRMQAGNRPGTYFLRTTFTYKDAASQYDTLFRITAN